ncbi:MAG: DNA-processing protein DprA [Endomicrobiales bacterium]|nr:DNA-processing protein DprA [Endomicrobiales bacterium]
MCDSEQKAIIKLLLIDEMGPRRYQSLVKRFGSPAGALDAPEEELALVEGLSGRLAKKIRSQAAAVDVDKEMEEADRAGVRIITHRSGDYPKNLLELPDYPPVLYVRGDLDRDDDFSVSVVGTRTPTPYGRSAAAFISKGLAREGITTVSGLARGIDSEVHVSTLAAGGRTIAVLGNGLGVHYPPENRKLEEKIAKNGALISEFPMSTRPDRMNFPRRNRIISGFSLGTAVVEADIKSGAMITAKYAAEQGKDVFAVPGPVFSKFSNGPNYLIKSGAHAAESAGDIIDELRIFSGLKNTPKKAGEPDVAGKRISREEQRIISALESEPGGLSIDLLGVKTNFDASRLCACLMNLEMKGAVRCLPGRIYVKIY